MSFAEEAAANSDMSWPQALVLIVLIIATAAILIALFR